MRLARFARFAAVGGAAVTLALVVSSPASAATTTINLNPGQTNKTASQFEHSCAQIPSGSVPVGKDGWVFVLPGNPETTGDFVSLTLVFGTSGGDVTVHITGDSATYPMGIVDDNGTSKAYVVLPAGWTLKSGSAVISGTADFFNVTHTCVSTSTGSPSPSKSPTPSESTSTTPGGPGGSSSSGGGGGLPITGAPLTGIIVSGMVLIAGGVALFVMRRRRDTTTTFMVE